MLNAVACNADTSKDRRRILCIPRLRADGDNITAGSEMSEMVAPLIIGRHATTQARGFRARGQPREVECDLGLANGFARFIRHHSGDCALRGKAEQQIAGVQLRANCDGTGKLFVLVKRLQQISARLRRQGVLAGSEAGKQKAAVFAGDHRGEVIALSHRGNGHAGMRKGLPGNGINQCSADLETSARECGRAFLLRGNTHPRGQDEKATKDSSR